MSYLPTLHREDVQAALSEMYRERRQHHLFAFFGTGEPGEVDVEAGRVRICPVASELELRMKMPALDDESARIAFLVPFRTAVPMDLAGRFARDGRVRVIGREQRVLRIFRAESVDDEVLKSPLLDYLLTPGAPQSLPSRSQGLSLDEMWRAFLAHAWDLPADEDLALDRLLAWAARDGRGPAFQAKLAAAGADKVLTALDEYLVQRRGEAAGVVLRAWCKGQGARALEYALLLQPLLPEPSLALWIRTQLRAELAVEDGAVATRVARQLADAAPSAAREYARHASKAEVTSLYRRAEALANDPEVRAKLVDSQLLPCAWELRLDDFGRALGAAAHKPDAAAFAHAAAMLDRVEKHELFKDDASRPVMRRAEMALRLFAWLCSDHSALEPGLAESPYADVERLGAWYAREGGFVDWARRTARGQAKSLFDKGVQTVVATVDERRRALDQRFARALPRWVEARRPAQQVVPIDDVSRRVVARFLAGEPSRSLLVLLLDGMAWAQTIEILLSLEEEPAAWGPIAWHGDRKHQLGDSPYPVVLAGFPTVTEISRNAFFAGKVATSGRDHTTDKDPDRWRDNPHIAPFVPAGDTARLLLRGEGHAAHGVASQEALSLVRDRRRRVVALVINAIDAALKGDAQQWHPWRVENVRSLPALLAEAQEAGRAVLLASDHGHVPADLLEHSAGAMTAGARWRPLATRDAPVEPHEVRLSGEGVWVPKGAQAVALLNDDRHRYGGGAHAGEHGGATLAEVVAPCVLIRWEDPLAAQHDPALAPTKLHTPPWWYRELVAREPAGEAAPRPRKTTAPPPPSAQLGLPDIAPPPAPEPVAPPPPPQPAKKPSLPPAVRALGDAPTIKALERSRRDRLLRAVAFLLERNGLAKLDAFAAHLNTLPFRVRGLVANELSPVLNVDGYQVISCDEHHVRLERDMLAQQFEVTL